MPLTIHSKRVHTHTRYVVTFADQPPTLTTIHGLTRIVRDGENPAAVWLLHTDHATPVAVDHDPEADHWAIFVPELDDAGEASVVETIRYRDASVVSHLVFVDGFDNDTVPTFQ